MHNAVLISGTALVFAMTQNPRGDGRLAAPRGPRVRPRPRRDGRVVAELSRTCHLGVAIPLYTLVMWLAICTDTQCQWERVASTKSSAEFDATSINSTMTATGAIASTWSSFPPSPHRSKTASRTPPSRARMVYPAMRRAAGEGFPLWPYCLFCGRLSISFLLTLCL